ncbi:hypothetical protein [Limosilactobacillus reuteri]|uniref:hypothetical protein n=1 Tax=Limosilactobacillus reuteri TaxID=1598 RepID=UPI0015DFAAAA|nr:hypothetical protein [Limosilactobacillus reuteri]QLL75812.1 hypothetical protein GTO86_04185 [Limosilactobacillus reuteri]
MLVKGKVERQDETFIIHNPTRPNFDDYISDLAVMFDLYPTESKEQLSDVRLAMKLIDNLEEVADRLPKVPRKKKEVKKDD